MSSKSSKDRLPFEPQQKKKKAPKKKPVQSQTEPQKTKSSSSKAKVGSIPDAVSKRMVRRMALFSGIPTFLGMSSFVLSYLIVSHQWFKLPTVAVVLVSMGFFGLGVLGLSYGILSTSWDEERVGSWWGWQEFGVNFGRMTAAWRSARQEARREQ